MLRAPSRRKKREVAPRLNLIPILDAVFIFIFFLLLSANFIKIYEISSDIPLLSPNSPPSKKKPLALTLKISKNAVRIYRNVPSVLIKSIGKTADGEYDLEGLHTYLLNIKTKYKKERNIIIEPTTTIKYEQIVKIMDSARSLRKTDPAFFEVEGKGNERVEVRHYNLFDKIVFGNIQG